jgi:hypothetical protein
MTRREPVPIGAHVQRIRKKLPRALHSGLIAAFVVLGCWGGPGVPWTRAQGHPSPSKLVQNLQSEQMTDDARDELLRRGKSDPEIRQYLTAHLPSVIESGESSPDCSGNSCEPWLNAVHLAGRLKIGAAAPALAKWIDWRNPGAPVLGMGPEARLVFNPAARALIEIGDPAVPAVQHALEYGNSREHYRALRVLCIIHSASAKAVLRDHLQHEPDPDLQAMIKRALEEK